MTELKIEHIVKDFGKGKGVFNISFTVENGEFFVMLGPSGCGKTTTLRIIAGLETLDSGRIFLDDVEITDFPPKDRDMAMVFQNYALYPFLNVAENLAFPLKKRKMPKNEIEAKVSEIASTLGISELLDMKPGQISGGQRQRVALGRALVREPSVFLMDEPLSNLDAKLRTTMRGELKRIQKSFGITTIFVTHDQVEAMTLADKVALINSGVLVQLDSPDQAYNYPKDSFVGGFLGDPQMNMIPVEVLNQDGKMSVKLGDQTLTGLDVSELQLPDGTKSIDALLGIRPEDVEVGDSKGIRVKVLIVQDLGRRQIEHFRLVDSGLDIIRIIDGDSNLSEGQITTVSPAGNHFYLFDKASSLRIWPMPEKKLETTLK